MQALQFEWAWQHPEKSKAVRDDVAALVSSCKRAGLSGAKGKVGGCLALQHRQQTSWKMLIGHRDPAFRSIWRTHVLVCCMVQ